MTQQFSWITQVLYQTLITVCSYVIVVIFNSGTIRVTDFALIPYLQELCGASKNPKGDLAALGALIESLSPTPHSEMRDFIEK